MEIKPGVNKSDKLRKVLLVKSDFKLLSKVFMRVLMMNMLEKVRIIIIGYYVIHKGDSST